MAKRTANSQFHRRASAIVARGASTTRNLWKALLALTLVFAGQLAHADGPGPLDGALFGTQGGTLVVYLHGDLSKGGPADYLYDDASAVAGKGVVAFAMLRPGYSDTMGRKSSGSDNGRRDHYSRKNNQLVASTISNLVKASGATRVIAVGHSGGAAQIAAIIGTNPGLIDVAVLVSCPCDIAKWRLGRGAWKNSQSPIAFANKVPATTSVILINGSRDTNTPPTLEEGYAAQLAGRGVPTQAIIVPGARHDFNGSLAAQTGRVVRSVLGG